MRLEPPDDDYREAIELRLALRRFLRRSERVVRAHGLTPQRYQLLLFIKAADGRATVGGLTESLQLGQAAVTQLVRRAENLGLVRRHLSKTDARVRFLELTPDGERRLAGAVAELSEDRAALIDALAELTHEA